MSNLFEHQHALITQAPDRYLFAWGTGTGKSRTALELASLKTHGPKLVICPKSLKENWRREILKWCGSDDKWTIASKEEFRKYWNDLKKMECVIVDEAHYFAGKSQMAKALHSYFKKYDVPFRYLLTATPFLSTPWNIYILGAHLGKLWNYRQWQFDYFQQVKFGARSVWIPKKNIERAMRSHIKEIGSTLTLQECFDVPEQVFETEYFELTTHQKRAVKNNYEPNFMTKYIKQHQIENGIKIGDGYVPDEVYETNKFERIWDLYQSNKKIAVFCKYNLQIDHLKTFLTGKESNMQVYVLRGDTEDRQTVIDQANASDACVLIINTALSEGYELPTFDTVIYASLSYSFKDYQQSKGRVLRANALKKNYYVHLISGDIDKAVYESMMKKQDFDLQLFINEREGLPDSVQSLA